MKKNVLIVDDENIRHETIIKHCGNGCQFFFASNYDEAVAALTQENFQFDMICLDHDLGSGLTGYDLTKWIAETCMAEQNKQLSFDPKSVLILIHTCNPNGAMNMYYSLNNIITPVNITMSAFGSFYFKNTVSDLVNSIQNEKNNNTIITTNEEAVLFDAIINMMGYAILKQIELAITEIENILPTLKRVELQFIANGLLVLLHDTQNRSETANIYLTKCFEIFKTKEFKAIVIANDPPFQNPDLPGLFIERFEILTKIFISKKWISIEELNTMFKHDPSLN